MSVLVWSAVAVYCWSLFRVHQLERCTSCVPLCPNAHIHEIKATSCLGASCALFIAFVAVWSQA